MAAKVADPSEHFARTAPRLAIVVPCHNEQETLPSTTQVLLELLNDMVRHDLIQAGSFSCFVDDGSADETWAGISRLARACTAVKGIKLSRNFGHQGAVLAGMFECDDADAVVTIDADLQDDHCCIREMVREYRRGKDVVAGVRNVRHSDTAFKRGTAQLYYRLLRLMGVRTIYNHADFRLLSNRALYALRQFPEANLFLRGLIPLLGLPSSTVEYARRKRQHGRSNYNFAKMFALALDGVTSFSATPLRIVAAIGAAIALLSFATGIWALCIRLFTDGTVPGWASTVLPIYFLGGVQIFCIGVVGEYVGKIYLETKRRPRYLVQQRTWDQTGVRDDVPETASETEWALGERSTSNRSERSALRRHREADGSSTGR